MSARGTRGAPQRRIIMPDNDIWIAATANVRGWTLVSCDGHFDSIPDVDHVPLPIPQRC